jgi:tRNA nucleotidyltransferase/poly(A) polymerase
MSDYMFMLESHLSTDQSRVVSQVQAAAAEAGVAVFLTGGAMRDMLGGFAIRDLDFTVEGNPLKLAKTLAEKAGGEILASDDQKKSAELRFPGGVTAEIGMSRQVRHGKPGSKPHVSPATIHEDLRGRDFTVNAIALSLNRASRGLILDPNNGLADLERKELRAVHNYALYDDPARLLRLVRLRVRLGYTVEDRTRQQYENARQAEMESYISPRALLWELRRIAAEPALADVVRALDEEKLLPLFSPALTGPKVNLGGLGRLQKAIQAIPFGTDLHLDPLGPFLNVLTEKMTPKERNAMAAKLALEKPELDLWLKLDSRSKKLEKELSSSKLQKPSQLYATLCNAMGDQILYLYLRSSQRIVQDRIRNFFQKYLLTAQEITDKEVAAAGAEPGTPKFKKLKDEMIAARLDGRTKKPAPPPPPPEPVPPGPRGRPPGAGAKSAARPGL